jgi:hypothetical protein
VITLPPTNAVDKASSFRTRLHDREGMIEELLSRIADDC